MRRKEETDEWGNTFVTCGGHLVHSALQPSFRSARGGTPASCSSHRIVAGLSG